DRQGDYLARAPVGFLLELGLDLADAARGVQPDLGLDRLQEGLFRLVGGHLRDALELTELPALQLVGLVADAIDLLLLILKLPFLPLHPLGLAVEVLLL